MCQSGQGKPTRPQLYTKNYKTQRDAESGGNRLREEHTSWLPNNKGSALKTHIQETLYRLSRLYEEYVTVIDEKRGQKFESEKRGVCGRVWRKKGEGRHYIIIISKLKQI